MELFEIPLFDDDFFKMIFRLTLNLVVLTIIIRFLYYKYSGKQEYLFTYYMIGILVFLICFTLKKFELNLGMALGLFAIFGILRYRTNTIAIKEMTYLFVVIGISVINALANKKMSILELLLANAVVVISILVLERKQKPKAKQLISKRLIYQDLTHIKPEDSEALKTQLENKLGFAIHSFKVNDIDFSENKAKLTVYHYKENE